MDTVLFNTIWMTYNILLAFVAIILGFLMLKSKSIMYKVLFGILWFVFVPNTIYMLTDIIHIPKQFAIQENIIIRIILLIQYLLLIAISIITFIVALYPFEKMLLGFLKKKFVGRRKIVYLIIFIMNFFIALGVALGRFQRVNSWDVFINIEYVINQTVLALTSLQIFIIVFGILSNIIYFTLKKKLALPLKG